MQFRLIRQPTECEVRLIVDTGGLPNYGNFWCTVTPAPALETMTVELAPDAVNCVGEWIPDIARGIRRGIDWYREHGTFLVSFHVSITKMQHHPVASRPSVFEYRGLVLAQQLADAKYGTPVPLLDPPSFALLTPDVVGVARAIVEDGTFAHPILADALEEAGCEDALVLEHLRTCEDHGATCWVTTWLLQAHPPDPP